MLTTDSRPTSDGNTLWPSGQLAHLSASLSACVRGVMIRSTLGATHSDTQRISYFPASPMCSLSWWFAGESQSLALKQFDCALPEPSARTPMPGPWVLAGPQTRPSASWSPGPAHGMMVLVMPDALHLMTGLEPAELTNAFVDAATVLPHDWQPLFESVQGAASDAGRLAELERFLAPRWEHYRPTLPLRSHRYGDWAMHLAQRAAASAPGKSLRQLERRIKRWSGLPLRELRGFSRAEHAFFDAMTAQDMGDLDWAQVAADVGYADQSHLCRVTRRYTGFSPEALRRGIASEESFWAYRIWM